MPQLFFLQFYHSRASWRRQTFHGLVTRRGRKRRKRRELTGGGVNVVRSAALRKSHAHDRPKRAGGRRRKYWRESLVGEEIGFRGLVGDSWFGLDREGDFRGSSWRKEEEQEEEKRQPGDTSCKKRGVKEEPRKSHHRTKKNACMRFYRD